jgi:predicted nucleotidyltransferase
MSAKYTTSSRDEEQICFACFVEDRLDSMAEILMKPSEALERYRAEIRLIVERHRTRNARVFGSVLHGEDEENSDLDLLVDATEFTTLFDLGGIQCEVSQLLGVGVDVLTPGALPDKWRERVLREAGPV